MRIYTIFLGFGLATSLLETCKASRQALSDDEQQSLTTARTGSLSSDDLIWFSRALIDALLSRESKNINLDASLRSCSSGCTKGYSSAAMVIAGLNLDEARHTPDGLVEVPEYQSSKSHHISVLWPSS
ncbi:MAG: hypothetical protein H6849_04535 [Alphaproteobacteria bacterium]|nr:MAG: hypothetical protein H6849_04535 [Alphaproteobacteria bacterium]